MAAKTGPFIADGYVKVRNTTEEVQLFDTTGALYTGGYKLTAPSAAAWTGVGTTATQSLTNKTINNITITDPGTAATLTISSGGTLETAGAFQHKFTAAANSAVTMPSATDATLMWTTETVGQITAKTSQINVLGVITWASTVANTQVDTTTPQTLSNKTYVNFLETIVATSSGLVPSSMTAYGISYVSYGGDYTTSPRTATLANPIIGVEKTIIIASTVAVANPIEIYLGANTVVGGSSDQRYIFFSTLAEEWQAISLVGITTAQWAVKSVNSTVGGFGIATGIRPSSIATTS